MNEFYLVLFRACPLHYAAVFKVLFCSILVRTLSQIEFLMHPVEFDLIFPNLFVDSLHVFLPIAGHFLLVLHHLVTALIVDLLRLPLVRLHKHLQGFLCFPLINLVDLIGFLAVCGNKTNFFVVFLRFPWGRVLKLSLVLELLTVVKAFIFLFLLHLKAQVLLVLDIHATLLLLLQAGVMLHGHQVLNH